MTDHLAIAIVGLFAFTLAGCAATQNASPTEGVAAAPLTKQQAHIVCYQQMQAARAGSLNVTPNRHQYVMCMKAKGFDT